MAIRCPEDDRPLGVNGIQQRLVGPILAEQAQVERISRDAADGGSGGGSGGGGGGASRAPDPVYGDEEPF